MKRLMPRLPRGGWTRVIGWSSAITLFVTLVAITGSYFGAEWFNGGAKWGDIVVALIIPLLLSPPICAVLFYKQEQLRRANEKLHVYATTDSLTGAMSRGAFTVDIERILSAPGEPGTSPGSLLILDVDKFKQINDSYGHQQGDAALRLISAAIRANMRAFDRLGRLGGEEFGVFLVEAAPEYAEMVAERIRAAISEIDLSPEVGQAQLSISIGISTAAARTKFSDLYHHADMNLYRAKTGGRNQVVADGWDEDDEMAWPHEKPPAPISSVA